MNKTGGGKICSIALLSLPWSIGWVALSFLVCSFVCPAMVTSFPSPFLGVIVIKISFEKWSEMARKLVKSFFWHHDPPPLLGKNMFIPKMVWKGVILGKKKLFLHHDHSPIGRWGGGHSGQNQGVRPSYYNVQISPRTLCTISTDCFAEPPVTVSFDHTLCTFNIFIFMSFDTGRRRVLLTIKYISIMKQNAAARWHYNA